MATQDSDNPDLRDRGFIYWRLLSTDPAAAKEVVLAEKPLISEETDLIEPTLLDELICHISSLASVYHKPPTAFVEGRSGLRKSLPARQVFLIFFYFCMIFNMYCIKTILKRNFFMFRTGSQEIYRESAGGDQPSIIPTQESLIGDLLSMDISGPAAPAAPQTQPAGSSGLDLLGGGLDTLVSLCKVYHYCEPYFYLHVIFYNVLYFCLVKLGGDVGATAAAPISQTTTGLLGDIFGFSAAPSMYVAPKVNWLPAEKGKGLDVWGTFSRKYVAVICFKFHILPDLRLLGKKENVIPFS